MFSHKAKITHIHSFFTFHISGWSSQVSECIQVFLCALGIAVQEQYSFHLGKDSLEECSSYSF